ncbi:LytTR family transcriptional regulator, partial [Clostridioides difficile]|nr:LytTR family transcriptional regulator [Clostridioides difficile]
IKMSNGHICRISNTYRNILKNIIKT